MAAFVNSGGDAKVAAAVAFERDVLERVARFRGKAHRSDIIEFCCADCKNDPNIRGKDRARGQVMGVVWSSDGDPDISVWIPTRRDFRDIGIGADDPGDVLPLNDRDQTMIPMSCRVSWHPTKAKLPAWVMTRANKARDDGYLVVHL